ncbi:MAG: hypothetical protein ACR2GY_10425, partial [Phycisphaerales bacterium]
MVHQLLLIVSVVGIVASPPLREVARDDDGNLFAMTEAHVPHGGSRLVVVTGGKNERHVAFIWNLSPLSPEMRRGLDANRLTGPIVWGVTGDGLYRGSHTRVTGGITPADNLSGTNISATISSVSDQLTFVEAEGDEQREAGRRIQDAATRNGCVCMPLVQYIRDNADALASRWDLHHDLLYTSTDQVTAIAVRQGVITRWDLMKANGNVHAPWTTHNTEKTSIDGPFRVMRAGDDLANHYLIDETGVIYLSPSSGGKHRQIGSIENFDSGDPDILTLIFEDQMTQQIGILHADTKANVTPLAITWKEEGFAQDFYA